MKKCNTNGQIGTLAVTSKIIYFSFLKKGHNFLQEKQGSSTRITHLKFEQMMHSGKSFIFVFQLFVQLTVGVGGSTGQSFVSFLP